MPLIALGAGEGEHLAVRHLSVALPVPTTAGTPSSLLTMAAWLVGPPWSVTIPAARCMMGTQSGSVISVTRMEPSRNRSMSAASADHAGRTSRDRVADGRSCGKKPDRVR